MTDILGDEPVQKLESDIARALRRRQAHEALLAAMLLELAPFSPRLCLALERAVAILVKRAAFDRLLYVGALRALAEHREAAVIPHLTKALDSDEAGGLGTLYAAGLVKTGEMTGPLGRVLTKRQPHLVFAAEVARIARGESNGEHSTSVAPKIKESSRLSLCSDVCVPLLSRPPLPRAIAPGVAVLRDAERHIGRWLVWAEVGVRAGDAEPVALATRRAVSGTSSSRGAWALAAWALKPKSEAPRSRPALEVLARLSHRPAAERDLSFLFRMGEAKLGVARPLLENMADAEVLGDGVTLRAALLLCQRYGVQAQLERLVSAARCHQREALRGLAAAALFDLGQVDLAGRFADELVNSNNLSTLGWAALIRAGNAGQLKRLVTESRYRRVQCGWVE